MLDFNQDIDDAYPLSILKNKKFNFYIYVRLTLKLRTSNVRLKNVGASRDTSGLCSFQG